MFSFPQAVFKLFLKDFALPLCAFGLVIDVMHERVYYQSSNWNVLSLPHVRHSAAFQDSDLERLIKAIEGSDLRNWQYRYSGTLDRNASNNRSWSLGILFYDGTMLRRSGVGDFDDGLPPRTQFDTLVEFVRTIGEEIILRHSEEISFDE